MASFLLLSVFACGGRPPEPGADAGLDPRDGGMLADAAVGDDAGVLEPDAGSASDAGPTLAQRRAAAETTARTNAACTAIAPFYWEVGDGSGALTSGSVTPPGGTAVTATTTLAIASATKWLYGIYWVQRVRGALSAADIKFLTFQSGYTNFGICGPAVTVDACLNARGNGDFDASTENVFHYGGGHMQKHASLNGLGSLTEGQLAAELVTQLGADVSLGFNSPQPAGGGDMSAQEYAKVLRKVLRGDLLMRDALGSHAVCASTAACGRLTSSPAPANEAWRYSIGHWVEADAQVGDGAFSSAGAFGFYPWIDATRSSYGVISRRGMGAGAGSDSVRCGRLIRKAWATGVAP